MEDTLDDYVKLLQNVKEKEPEIENKKEYLVTAQRKKESEARAVKIVEFSIDGKLRPEIFTKCLPHINQSYYQDIVEERAIIKLCGYSICGKKIPDMPKKQYYISSKNNKIYDITDRKNFCSNFCYKASTHIKNQIDDGPLWLRKLDDIPEYQLLGSENKGLPGECINQEQSKPQPSFISVNNFTQASLIEMIDKKDTQKKNPAKQKITKLVKTLQTITENNEEEIEIQKNKKSQIIENLNVKQHKKNNLKPAKINIENVLKNLTKELITVETLIFLYEEKKITKINYADINKKINLQELTGTDFDAVLKPLPDFNKLKLESKNLNVKVKCFYNGILHDDNLKKINEVDVEEMNVAVPAVLPLVDGNSQNAMRRKIFLNAATKSMKELLDVLKINIPTVISDLQSLVKTFNLTADNIMFKPVIWNYISIILLKILALKDSNINNKLEEEFCRDYIKLQFSILPRKDGIISEIMGDICEGKLFIENCTPSN